MTNAKKYIGINALHYIRHAEVKWILVWVILFLIFFVLSFYSGQFWFVWSGGSFASVLIFAILNIREYRRQIVGTLSLSRKLLPALVVLLAFNIWCVLTQLNNIGISLSPTLNEFYHKHLHSVVSLFFEFQLLFQVAIIILFIYVDVKFQELYEMQIKENETNPNPATKVEELRMKLNILEDLIYYVDFPSLFTVGIITFFRFTHSSDIHILEIFIGGADALALVSFNIIYTAIIIRTYFIAQ